MPIAPLSYAVSLLVIARLGVPRSLDISAPLEVLGVVIAYEMKSALLLFKELSLTSGFMRSYGCFEAIDSDHSSSSSSAIRASY